MICQKTALRVVSFFAVVFVFASATAFAQVFQRPRIVSPQPTTSTASQPTSSTNPNTQRPILTSKLVVSTPTYQPQTALVKKTVSSTLVNAAANLYNSNNLFAVNQRLKSEMDSRLGIPYRYGSTSGSSYDCSGLVWSVFQSAGIKFERSSARTYWSEFEPVYGDDRFQFGTLVFFNNLGHVGIVVDDKGFYQASSSKGVTYTPFAGYWEKRVVGYRRIPMNYLQTNDLKMTLTSQK